MLNNAKQLGSSNQNLILETAGRIYIKVADRFYELDFRDQNNKEQTTINNNIVQKEEADLSGLVTKKDLKSSLAQYMTKRDWQDVKQTQRMLEQALLDGFSDSINPITIQTMQVIVGSEQLQFEFISKDAQHPNGTTPYLVTSHNFGIQDGRLFCDPGLVLHHTIDCPDAVRPGSSAGYTNQQDTKYYCRWHVGGEEITWFDFDSNEQSYYLYIKAEKLSLTDLQRNEPANDSIKVGTADFFLSAEARPLDPGDGYYYFLYAIINSDTGDGRSIGTMNGFTEILPGQITAYIFKSADGVQFVDFLNKQFHIGYAPGPGEIATTGTVNNGSYMHWDVHNGLVIKGNITVTGGSLQETLDDLQRQIDDDTQAWFSGDSENTNPAGHKHDRPTNSSWPANEWYDDETPIVPGRDYKKNHTGDLFYITDGTYEGEAYRYVKDGDSYTWTVLADNSIAEALRTAYEAKALAEDAETKFNNWADDDVISPTEISDIRSEKEFVLSDYSEIYTNAHTFGVDTAVSTSAHVTELTSAYTAYLTDLNAVITAYNNRTNPTDCVTIPTGMGTHMSAYYTKREVVLTDIATAASTGISSAAAAASNAQTTANNVTTYVGQSLADGVLTKDEIEVLQTYKKSLSDQYNALVASYTDLIDQAYNVLQDPGLSHTSSVYTALSNAYAALTTTTTGTYALLDTAHTALVNAVNAILTRGATAVGSTDSALPALKTAFDTAASTFSTAISNYIEDVQELQNAVENAMKYITIAGYQYLTEAIVNGETTIAGGLVATNTIVLGNTPQSSGYKVTAGINGITTIEGVEDTSAIAAWYGGPFRDKTYYYDWTFNGGWVLKPDYSADPPSASDYAQTVFRHNGSGYVAGGAIAWSTDGSGSVANGALYWNASGIPTIAGGLEIDLTSGGQITLLQMANQISTLSSWFVKDTTTMPGKTLLRINMGTQQSTDFDGVIWDGFLFTGGDQILQSGTPGGGGGSGGASYLPDLQDVSDSLQSPSSGALLQYNATTRLWEGNTPATQIGSNITGFTTGKLIYDVLGDGFNSSWTVKQFINSSVATATATYRGNYNEKNDLNLNPSATHAQIAAALSTKMAALSIIPDDNDYCFVEIPVSSTTPTVIERTERYKYDGTNWGYEYTLNNSGFTSQQWDAINSGITSGKVSTYDTIAGYFSGGKILSTALPAMYIGKTAVQFTSATQDLTGIGNVTMDNAKYLRAYNSAGDTLYNLAGLNASNYGYLGAANSPRTYMRGQTLYFLSGDSGNTSALVISSSQNATFYGALYLQNNKQIYWKDTAEKSLGLLNLTSSNVFTLGSGLIATGDNARAYNTYIYGASVSFYTGSSTTGAVRKWMINSSGNLYPYSNKAYNLGTSSYYIKEAYIGKMFLAPGVYIEYVPASGDTPGYVHISSHLLTDGDQIVKEGVPGGGGGGGSEYLWELEDVDNALITPSNGVVLQYNATAGEWKGVASDTIGITTAGTVAELNAANPTTAKRVWSPSVLASWLSGKNYVENVAIGTGANAEKLAVTRSGATSYLTVPYATNVVRFKRYDGVEEAGGYDLNTLLSGGGITSEYTSAYNWANAPANMSYGGVVQLNPFVGQTLAMQLAWDIDHTNVKTGKLWWRDSIYKNSTHTWGAWHLIYDDTTLTKSVITGLLNSGSGTYLPLSGGAMSGNITIPNGNAIAAASTNWMLGISSNGTTFYCGPGNEISAAFLLRSGNINLVHRKFTAASTYNDYAIWDSSNTYVSNSALTIGSGSLGSSGSPIGYATQSRRPWAVAGTQEAGGFDLNTALVGGGAIRNVHSSTYWAHAPADATYFGMAWQLKPSDAEAGSMQFFWDGPYTGSTPTGRLFWRLRNSTGWADDWHRIYDSANANLSTIDWNCKDLHAYGIATIGTATAITGATLTVDGIIASTGDQVVTSDIRMKKNLKPIELKVEDIAKCRAVTFDWVTGGHSFGSIAQDWLPILPEAVKQGETLSLAYAQLATVGLITLAKHESEQDKEIRVLKDALGKANGRIEALEKEVKRLRA